MDTFKTIYTADQFEFIEETCTDEQLQAILESFDEDFDFYDDWSTKCPVDLNN